MGATPAPAAQPAAAPRQNTIPTTPTAGKSTRNEKQEYVADKKSFQKSYSDHNNGEKLKLDAFETGLLQDPPPDGKLYKPSSYMILGLYDVDIGFSGQDQGDLMAFADINADKYTDILTVRDEGNEI